MNVEREPKGIFSTWYDSGSIFFSFFKFCTSGGRVHEKNPNARQLDAFYINLRCTRIRFDRSECVRVYCECVCARPSCEPPLQSRLGLFAICHSYTYMMYTCHCSKCSNNHHFVSSLSVEQLQLLLLDINDSDDNATTTAATGDLQLLNS